MNFDIIIKRMYSHRRLLRKTNQYFLDRKYKLFYKNVIAPKDRHIIVHIKKNRVWIHLDADKSNDTGLDSLEYIKEYIKTVFKKENIIVKCNDELVSY